MGPELAKAETSMLLDPASSPRSIIRPGGHGAEPDRSMRLEKRVPIGLLFAAVALSLLGSFRVAPAEILCADDIVPEGMAVTATGTAASCAGSCRAREIKPVCGPIMKICAGQPIPKGYIVDSVTTLPACLCLGSEGDAYVIRYVGPKQDPTSDKLSDDEPFPNEPLTDQAYFARQEQLRNPYGDPPFGNVLCSAVNQAQSPPQPYGAPPWNANSLYQSDQARSAGGFVPGGQQLSDPRLRNGSPPAWPQSQPPQWNDQQYEPFRLGQ